MPEAAAAVSSVTEAVAAATAGEIVDAVNGDGQRGVSGGPVVVRDLIGDGVGEGRPRAKLPHGVRRVVQRVGP